MFWNKYPYSNLHDLNLDWIIRKLIEQDEKIKDFITVSSIKYADPIQWNITTQYEMNTVVVDGNGNAYISTQPVPVGVNITNIDYWSKIGNFDALWTSIKDAITVWDEGASATATVSHSVNDLVWLADQLVIVTQPMPAGTAYVIGTNCEYTTINDQLHRTPSLYYPTLADVLSADLQAGEYAQTLGYWAAGDGGDAVYLISTSGYVDGITVYQMDNGNKAVLQLQPDTAVNIMKLGGKPDGSNDVSAMINAVTAYYAVYIPVGKFRVDNTILLKNNLFGDVSNRYTSSSNKASKLDATLASGNVIEIKDVVTGITIKDLDIIHTNSDADCIWFHPTNNPAHFRCENLKLTNIKKSGIWVSPENGMSRAAYIDNCCIICSPFQNTRAIYFSNNAYDCRVTNTEIMGCRVGIEAHGGLLFLANVHVWCSNTGTSADKSSWWSQTGALKLYTTKLTGSNVYLDSARFYIWDADGKSTVNITGMETWCDSTVASDIESQYYDGTLVYVPSGQGHDGTYYFSNGFIYCDRYHSNMFNDANKLFHFTNMKFILQDASDAYTDTSNQYVTPWMKQINNGEMFIPNYGSAYQSIMEYFSVWGCHDEYIISGDNDECVKLKLSGSGVTKEVLGSDINVYTQTFTAGNRTGIRIYVPSKRYYITKVIASGNARARIYCNYIFSNAPFQPYTQSDTTGLTPVA